MANRRRSDTLPSKVTHVTLTRHPEPRFGAGGSYGYESVAWAANGDKVWYNDHRTHAAGVRAAERKARFYGVDWRDESQNK